MDSQHAEAPGEARTRGPRKARLAVASLILGIMGLAMLQGYFFLREPVFLLMAGMASLPALVLGITGLRRILRSERTLEGEGMAIAGILLGGGGLFFVQALQFQGPAYLAMTQGVLRVLHRSECLGNVGCLTQFVRVYAEHHGVLPRTFDDLQSTAGGESCLMPMEDMLRCPLAKDQSAPSYELLHGGEKLESGRPVIVIRERVPHRDGYRTVGYSDGSVKRVTDEELR